MVILDLQQRLLSENLHKSGQGFLPVTRMILRLQSVLASQDHMGVETSFSPSQDAGTGGLSVPVNMEEISIRDVFHDIRISAPGFAEVDIRHDHTAG